MWIVSFWHIFHILFSKIVLVTSTNYIYRICIKPWYTVYKLYGRWFSQTTNQFSHNFWYTNHNTLYNSYSSFPQTTEEYCHNSWHSIAWSVNISLLSGWDRKIKVIEIGMNCVASSCSVSKINVEKFQNTNMHHFQYRIIQGHLHWVEVVLYFYSLVQFWTLFTLQLTLLACLDCIFFTERYNIPNIKHPGYLKVSAKSEFLSSPVQSTICSCSLVLP